MSEFESNQGTSTTYSRSNNNEEPPEIYDGIRYKGEKTDFRFDPSAAVKKTWINYNRPVKLTFGDKTIELTPKQDAKMQSRLAFISMSPNASIQEKETVLSNQGYAERIGFRNPDALMMAINHYAATEEYIRNMELEEEEEEE